MTHRILFIAATLQRTAAAKSIARLALDLPRDAFDVHIVALSAGGPVERELREAGLPVTVLGQRLAVDPFAYWKLRSFIKHLRPDLLQTWNFSANSYGRIAARAGGVKTTIASELCEAPWKRWTQRTIDRRLAADTARVVVSSPGVRDFYVAGGIASEKFTIIPGGVTTHVDESTRSSLRAELELPADARLIGAVGRLSPRKRLRDPIWSTDLLKVARDDVHLLIVGDGPERADLMRYRDQVEIRDRVHFLGEREDLPRLLSQLDLLWHASGYEGFPYPVAEAMAAGLPVVATDNSGNRQLVDSQETGYLVPVGDRAALARYANKLLDDAELAKRLGEAGRAKVLAEFPAQKMVDAHAALYRELLTG